MGNTLTPGQNRLQNEGNTTNSIWNMTLLTFAKLHDSFCGPIDKIGALVLFLGLEKKLRFDFVAIKMCN